MCVCVCVYVCVCVCVCVWSKEVKESMVRGTRSGDREDRGWEGGKGRGGQREGERSVKRRGGVGKEKGGCGKKREEGEGRDTAQTRIGRRERGGTINVSSSAIKLVSSHKTTRWVFTQAVC